MNLGGVEIQKRHVTLTGIVAGGTLVAASLGGLAQGVIKLDQQLGASNSERDSLYAEVRMLSRRVAKLEGKAGIKRGKIIHKRDQKREGVVRRVFHILF